MLDTLNEKLKGWRGILLACATFIGLLAESIANVIGPMLIGGQLVTKSTLIGAGVMGVVTVAKLLITDAGKK
jgi:Mn2+/Fe2+ NRAMP family transporter